MTTILQLGIIVAAVSLMVVLYLGLASLSSARRKR